MLTYPSADPARPSTTDVFHQEVGFMKKGFLKGLLYPSFSPNQSKENTFQLGYHESHRREQAGNHSTSISVTDSILWLPTTISLWKAFSSCSYLPRPCSPKGLTLPHLLGEPGPRCHISPAGSSAETAWDSLLTTRPLLNFILIPKEVHTTQPKIKKVQKLKVQKLELLLSQQLSLGFTKRDYSFINVCILRSLGLGKKHKKAKLNQQK